MPQPHERLRALTLSLEAAISTRDWPTANALLASREEEIAKLSSADRNGLEDILRLDQKLQANLEVHMEGLRKRMQSATHVRRTVKAFQNARPGRERIDLAG